MGNDKPGTNSKRHLFQVEILLEDNSPALAIAALMQLLSHAKVKDFRITGGMELGKAIEEALAASTTAPIAAPFPLTKASYVKAPAANAEASAEASAVPAANAKAPKASAAKEAGKERLQLEMLEEYKERGTLVRLTVVKGKGIKLSMPCRILNFDPSNDQLTIYHVDEKRVYSFKLNEIEDIVGHGN